MKKVALVGGSGFLGMALCETLKQHGYEVRVVSRSQRTREGMDWRIYRKGSCASLAAALEGCHAVVNLVGILNAGLLYPEDFYKAHVEFVTRLMDACQLVRVQRLLHVSALNASPDAASRYLSSKGAGEMLVQDRAGMAVTVFRPSVIFGRGDRFFSRFYELVNFAPGVLAIPCPNARLSPVYVMDVSRFMVNCLENDECVGASYELCGPKVYTLREIFEYLVELSERRLVLFDMPDALSRSLAHIVGFLPGRLFTIDNYRSLQLDGVCTASTAAAKCLVAVEDIVPGYLGRR